MTLLIHSFAVSGTRRILQIVNSDDEDGHGDEQHTVNTIGDLEEDEDEGDNFAMDEDAGEEDDDLQQLHASQVGTTLQQEVVKISCISPNNFAHYDYISKLHGEVHVTHRHSPKVQLLLRTTTMMVEFP